MIATLKYHYCITSSLLRIVLLSWCDERIMLLTTIYLFCVAWTSFHLWWPQPFSEWCRYHLPMTTYWCCMAWSLFIDVLLFVAILDHHYFSLSPSYLSITLSLLRVVLYRGVMHEWYQYQLSTTTYLFCMAWTLFIDVSACDCNPWPSLLSLLIITTLLLSFVSFY